MFKRFQQPGTNQTKERDVGVKSEARAMFAAILLLIAGRAQRDLRIAAISNAAFFDHQTQYVIFGLGFWGWATLIIGLVQLTGGYSLFAAASTPHVGIIAATLARSSPCSRRRQLPVLVPGILPCCLIVLHGLVVYGEPVER